MMLKRSFGPKNFVQKILYKPCSFALEKTAPRSDVVCWRLPKSSDTGVVVNTKGGRELELLQTHTQTLEDNTQ